MNFKSEILRFQENQLKINANNKATIDSLLAIVRIQSMQIENLTQQIKDMK